MQRQKLMREFAFSRSWAGTYIPPSIIKHVATQPLLNPNKPKMIKNVKSPKMGNQGPRLETLQDQKSGQNRTRRQTSVPRILGLWTVR
jgi:hypothetical protein